MWSQYFKLCDLTRHRDVLAETLDWAVRMGALACCVYEPWIADTAVWTISGVLQFQTPVGPGDVVLLMNMDDLDYPRPEPIDAAAFEREVAALQARAEQGFSVFAAGARRSAGATASEQPRQPGREPWLGWTTQGRCVRVQIVYGNKAPCPGTRDAYAFVFEDNPDAYVVPQSAARLTAKAFWAGYRGQKCVVHVFNGNLDYDELLELLRPNPTRENVPTESGVVAAAYTKVVVVTDAPPAKWYPETSHPNGTFRGSPLQMAVRHGVQTTTVLC